jgi:hypothetical protein
MKTFMFSKFFGHFCEVMHVPKEKQNILREFGFWSLNQLGK